MEWVQGPALYAWAEEHGLTLRRAMRLLAQVARALEATHRYGLHRDVKGGNIAVTPEERAMLLDFGSGSHKNASPLTDDGLPLATERYRSPQLNFLRYARRLGAKGSYTIGPADEVYSLGVTAYRLLAGAYPPHDSESESEVAAKPTRLLAPRGLDDRCPQLGELILRMLSEDPLPRGSAKEVAEELEYLIGLGDPALDAPWGVSSAQPPTEDTEPLAPPSPPAPRKPRAHLAPGGVIVTLVLVLLLLPHVLDRGEGGSTEAAWCGQPVAELPEAGTDGMGDEAVSSVESAEHAPISGSAIGRKVPKRPLGDQARPPRTQRGGGGDQRGMLADPKPGGGDRALRHRPLRA